MGNQKERTDEDKEEVNPQGEGTDDNKDTQKKNKRKSKILKKIRVYSKKYWRKYEKPTKRFLGYANSFIHYLGLMFFIIPFWFVLFAMLLSIQNFLKEKNTELFSIAQVTSTLLTMCIWFGIIIIILAFLSDKLISSSNEVSPFLKKTTILGVVIGFFIIVTIALLSAYYFYGVGNAWLTNLTIAYLLTLSYFSSIGIVKLYEWIFTGNAVDEKIKLKLSFINKLLVGGFGLIATVLGIALTIKNLFS